MQLFNGAIQSINAAALLLGAAGLLSRILGVLRDRLLAANFGAGRELDAYYMAFQIPDFMSILFLLGAASAAILPVFQEHLSRDREEAHRLISELATIFFFGSVLFSLFALAFAPSLIRIVAPGFSPETQELAATLTRIMLLSPVLLGLSGIFSTVVQSFQRFFAYALAPILYNLGIILGIALFVPFLGVAGLAVGVALGAFLHFAINLTTARTLGFPVTAILGRFSEGVRRVFALSFPRVLSVSLTQLTLLVLVALGSTLAEGSIAVFNLAQNLYYMPIGIFGVSYAVVLFPRLSQSFLKRDARSFFRELSLGIRSILFWLVPASVLLLVLRAHVVRVALGAGLFSWEDTRLTAAILAALAIAVAAGGLTSLLIKGFYALGNTWLPLVINLIASAFSLALAFLLVRSLTLPSGFWRFLATLFRIGDLPDPRVLGLALGFSVGLALNVILLFFALRRLAARAFGESHSLELGTLAKIVIASLFAGGAAYLVRVSFSETLPLITFVQVLLQGAGAGLAGVGVYFGSLYLMREEGVREIADSLQRRLFNIKILPSSWDGQSEIRQ